MPTDDDSIRKKRVKPKYLVLTVSIQSYLFIKWDAKDWEEEKWPALLECVLILVVRYLDGSDHVERDKTRKVVVCGF